MILTNYIFCAFRYAWAFVGSPEHLELSQTNPPNGLVRSVETPKNTKNRQQSKNRRTHTSEIRINGDVVNFIAKDIEGDVVLIEKSPTKEEAKEKRVGDASTEETEHEALEAEMWQEEVNRSSESGSVNEVKFLPHVSRIAQLMRDKVSPKVIDFSRSVVTVLAHIIATCKLSTFLLYCLENDLSR